MLRLKKIDKMVSQSFIGPAVLSFFVAEFVLIMQFLWKYIDEILGKGFTVLELMELIIYYGITLIPLAVPITILISSVMVFGDMAEKYELSSMKSAGISLFRVMLPGLVIASMVGLFSIFASNYLKPASNLQFQKRFIALRKQKSALAIEEGVFNDAFNDVIIRVSEVDKNGRDIKDVLIYDHSANDKSQINFLTAKKGQMFTAEEGKYFVMKLDSGVQYRELDRKSQLGSGKTEMPFTRTYFEEWVKTFDMSIFGLDEGILNINTRKEDMLNTFQILETIDSFKLQIINNDLQVQKRKDDLIKLPPLIKNNPDKTNEKKDSVSTDSAVNTLTENMPGTKAMLIEKSQESNIENPAIVSDSTIPARLQKKVWVKEKRPFDPSVFNQSALRKDTSATPAKRLLKQEYNPLRKAENLVATFTENTDRSTIINQAMADLSRDRDELVTFKNVDYENKKAIDRYNLRMHQQYSWALVCVVFLFIGAPMGSIIRKGGYGYPFLVAILFYMLFIITTIMGEKLVKTDSLSGTMAAWTPCLILMPFAFVLSFLALRDVKINLSFVNRIYYRIADFLMAKFSGKIITENN
jgi:lipopolysaccharide export system permease protein